MTHCLCTGWITLYIVLHHQIDMDFVRQYQPGRAIPEVMLRIKKIGDRQPTEDGIRVNLKNVHSPKYFTLLCTHNTTTTGWLLHILTCIHLSSYLGLTTGVRMHFSSPPTPDNAICATLDKGKARDALYNLDQVPKR